MVRRGLASSREEARVLIEKGLVTVAGAAGSKPARLVAASEPVEVVGAARRFVSRGGEKLDAALDRFEVLVEGRRCLDAGASTGGFTDCLLVRNAAHVVSVDVGYGQLDARLRKDSRVTVMERTNIRSITAAPGGPFEIVVADLSFISLTAVAPVLCGELAAAEADLVVLVKPQFEAGREAAGKGRGVIRDPEVRLEALSRVASALEAAGASIIDAMASPLLGPAGNAEYFLHARAHAPTSTSPGRASLDAALGRAIAESPVA